MPNGFSSDLACVDNLLDEESRVLLYAKLYIINNVAIIYIILCHVLYIHIVPHVIL